MSNYTNVKDILARVGVNGNLQFGFILTTDVGLRPEEYVVIPADSKLRSAASPVEYLTGGKSADVYQRRFAACLCSDFDAVSAMSIVEELKPLVRATRAHSYALGFLSDGNEVTRGTFSGTEADIARDWFAKPEIPAAGGLNMQVGTFAIFCTAVNYYQTNHNTAGNRLPKGQIKALRGILSLNSSVNDEQITRAVYLAAHATDKRAVLHGMLVPDMADKLVKPRMYGTTVTPTFDSWAALRVKDSMSPAGTGTLGVLRVLLTKVIEIGLAAFSPVPEATAALKSAFLLRDEFPGAFHPGARYLFNVEQRVLANVDELKGYIGVFGGMCQAAGYCNTVTSAPHIAAIIEDRKDAKWVAIGTTVAKGASLDTEKAKAAMGAMGVSVADDVPDYTADAEGYVAYTQGLLKELSEL